MMINVKTEETNRTRYVPIGLMIALVLMVEVYLEYPQRPLEKGAIIREDKGGYEVLEINGGETNIERLGDIMYTWEIIMYASLVLLVAMIGAIVLTLHHSEGVKRQELFKK